MTVNELLKVSTEQDILESTADAIVVRTRHLKSQWTVTSEEMVEILENNSSSLSAVGGNLENIPMPD